MSANHNSYYVIGSWIPILREMSFHQINRGLIQNIVNRQNYYYEIIQKDIETIDSITILNNTNNKKYGVVSDIKINSNGYWQGKMIVFIPMDKELDSNKHSWFDYLLDDIGNLIKSHYHKHMFHKDNEYTGIRVTYKKVKRDEYKSYIDIKADVLINIFDEYSRKFNGYIEMIYELESINYRKAFQFLTKARGELLYFKAFLNLHYSLLGEYMNQSDDTTEIIEAYIAIMADKSNFMNSEKVITKNNRLAYFSLFLGLVSLVITIILGFIAK